MRSAIATPPGSNRDGDAYIVAPNATGIFANQEGKLAIAQGGTYYFLTPSEGYSAFNLATGQQLIFDGIDSWQQDPENAIENLTTAIDTSLAPSSVSLVTATAPSLTIALNPPTPPYSYYLKTVHNLGSESFTLSFDSSSVAIAPSTSAYLALIDNAWVLARLY